MRKDFYMKGGGNSDLENSDESRIQTRATEGVFSLGEGQISVWYGI